jgi:hypothetical protein
MGSLIHELDNDALLMLYLADELSAEDRADVEQLLGVDAGLRAGLAVVRADGEAAVAALQAADRVDPPTGLSASAEAVTTRRIGRLLRQHQVDLFVRNRPAPTPERQPVFAAWTYPMGAVAAALLVAVGWWAWSRHAPARRPIGVGSSQLADNRPFGFGGGPGGFGGGGRMTSQAFVGDAFGGASGSTAGLADAEYEAATLRHDGDPAQLPSLFGDAAAAD